MNHHFAELGDVWKHLPLAEVLRVNPPRLYWETHAGSASYLLTESAATLPAAGAGLDVRVVDTDAVSAIEREAHLARVNARDVLVHVDPFDPFERVTPDSKTPVELAGWLADAGYRLMYWYG